MKRIIGVIYHPPGTDIETFLTAFDTWFTSISKRKTECLLTGHINIDLLKSDLHLDTEHFINNLHCHLLIPLNVRPTRFGTHSSTLIDNTCKNRPHDLCESGALMTDISDHLLIFYISQNTIKQELPKYFINTLRLQAPIILHPFSLF